MRRGVFFGTVVCLLLGGVLGCSTATLNAKARPAVDGQQLLEMVSVLASDEFEGRAPGGAGEAKTVAYLIQRFSELGLEPAGEAGGWTQSVELIHSVLEETASVRVYANKADGEPTFMDLRQGRDIAFETAREVEQLHIDEAPVVFVGYGVNAPEREWDDFGDVDLEGKVALFLVNDPDFYAQPDDAVADRFGGRTMTYYGRWTYKFEEAARRGALGALVIHDPQAAGYGWNVASSSPGDTFALPVAPGGVPPVLLQGWLGQTAAERVLAAAGLSLAELTRQARQPGFEAIELSGVQLAADVEVDQRRIQSNNVLARLPGHAAPQDKHTIMLSAHWDAYGIGAPDSRGAVVRPGANDDALGTAGVLELARVLKAGPPLDRSVVFALWTAEESGLLGSRAYAENPLFPLGTTVANLTLDILQTAGAARDVILVGEGQSDLEVMLAEAAALQGRRVTPESLPENGLFFRADHFSLAREGVPVLLLMGIAGAADLVDGGRAAGARWIEDYIGNCYHQTCDAVTEDWDLTGAIADIELFAFIVDTLGRSEHWPDWYPDSEFKAQRERSAPLRAKH